VRISRQLGNNLDLRRLYWDKVVKRGELFDYVISGEIFQAIKILNVTYQQTGPYTVIVRQKKESEKDIVVLFEVCLIPRLSVYGIHIERISGDIWQYKLFCSDMLSHIKL